MYARNTQHFETIETVTNITNLHTLEMLQLRTHATPYFTVKEKNIINKGIVGAVVPFSYLFIYFCDSNREWVRWKPNLESRVSLLVYMFVCLFIYLLLTLLILSVFFFLSFLISSIHPWLFLKLKRNDNSPWEYKMQVLYYIAYLVFVFMW